MSGYPPTSQGYDYRYGVRNQPPPSLPPNSPGGNNLPYGSSTSSPKPPSSSSAPPYDTPLSGPSDYGNYGAGPRPTAPSGYRATPPPGISEYGSYGAPPRPADGGYPPQASYGSPFASLISSGFALGTDPNIVACFQAADQDGSGFIDDKEFQGALSSYLQRFSMRTVHLLMYLFTNSNAMKIGTDREVQGEGHNLLRLSYFFLQKLHALCKTELRTHQ